MTPAVRQIVLGGGRRPYSAFVEQYFARLPSLPPEPLATAISVFLDGILADGVSAYFDAGYIRCVHDDGMALVNFMSSSFQGSLVEGGGAPTFTKYRGYQGLGITSTINNNFNPSTAGGLYARDDGLVAGRILSVAKSDQAFVQMSVGTLDTLYPCNAADSKTDWRVNGSTDNHTAANFATNPSGFWLEQRTASNAQALYHDDMTAAAGQTSALASAALANALIYSPGPYLNATFFIGKSMPEAKRVALKTRDAALVAVALTLS